MQPSSSFRRFVVHFAEGVLFTSTNYKKLKRSKCVRYPFGVPWTLKKKERVVYFSHLKNYLFKINACKMSACKINNLARVVRHRSYVLVYMLLRRKIDMFLCRRRFEAFEKEEMFSFFLPPSLKLAPP